MYELALRAGVRKRPGKEPAVGGVRVAVYGDLSAGRFARVMRRLVERTVADALKWSERRRGGFREEDLGVMGGIARVFSGQSAMGRRPRKWCPRSDDCNEVTTVIMGLRSQRRDHSPEGRAVNRRAR